MAVKVLLVVGDVTTPSAISAAIRTRLLARSDVTSVTYLQYNDADSTKANGFDVAVVDPSASSSSMAAWLANLTIPAFVATGGSSTTTATWGFQTGTSTAWTSTTRSTDMDILNADPVAPAGAPYVMFSNIAAVGAPTVRYMHGDTGGIAADVKRVLNLTTGTNRVAGAVLAKNATRADGSTNPAYRSLLAYATGVYPDFIGAEFWTVWDAYVAALISQAAPPAPTGPVVDAVGWAVVGAADAITALTDATNTSYLEDLTPDNPVRVTEQPAQVAEWLAGIGSAQTPALTVVLSDDAGRTATVTLAQGATQIMDSPRVVSPVPATATTYTFGLTAAEKARINPAVQLIRTVSFS